MDNFRPKLLFLLFLYLYNITIAAAVVLAKILFPHIKTFTITFLQFYTVIDEWEYVYLYNIY